MRISALGMEKEFQDHIYDRRFEVLTEETNICRQWEMKYYLK
jgi:hypothetical protein